jgi:hypothetical protein
MVIQFDTNTPWKGIIKNLFISVVGNHIGVFFLVHYRVVWVGVRPSGYAHLIKKYPSIFEHILNS